MHHNPEAGFVPFPSFAFTSNEREKELTISTVCKNVFVLMDLDKKTTALKKLQGYIWMKGYHDSELKGQ
jgi:methionine salvage enolase-phosphatase E1